MSNLSSVSVDGPDLPRAIRLAADGLAPNPPAPALSCLVCISHLASGLDALPHNQERFACRRDGGDEEGRVFGQH